MPITPTDDEIKQAVDVLNRLPKGFLPHSLFIAVAAKVTMPTMELVPVRWNKDGEVEVLLTQRPDDDPYWPNQWHMPGTVIRASDNEGTDFSSGMERVLQNELHGKIRMIGKPQYVGMKFWDVARGRELDQVFYFETDATDEDVVEGKFFLANNLPESTMAHHKIMIPEIATAFKAQSGK
jgi:hypothetical protein